MGQIKAFSLPDLHYVGLSSMKWGPIRATSIAYPLECGRLPTISHCTALPAGHVYQFVGFCLLRCDV